MLNGSPGPRRSRAGELRRIALVACGGTVIDDGKAEDAVKANVEHNLEVNGHVGRLPVAASKVEAGARRSTASSRSRNGGRRTAT